MPTMLLTSYRERERLSRAELAARLGVSVITVSRYERGLRRPTRTVMSRIVAATGGAVQPNDFYDAPGECQAPAAQAQEAAA